MSSENEKSEGAKLFVDLRDIDGLRITCSRGHAIPIPASRATTEEVATLLFEHCHPPSSPAGMNEDMQALSSLLSRQLTTQLMQIADIVKRREMKIEFEIKQTNR